MKAVALILSLLFFTGSQARHFWQHDEPQSPLDQLKNALTVYLDYVKDGGRTLASELDSSIGKDLDINISDILVNLTGSGFSDWYSTISFLPNEATIREETKKLREQLTKNVELIKGTIEPHLQSFEETWQKEVEKYWKNIVPFAEKLQEDAKKKFEAFHKELSPIGELLREQVQKDFDFVQKHLSPYPKNIKKELSQKLHELRENVMLTQKLETFKELATSFLQILKENVGPFSQSLKADLLSFLEESRKQLAEH